jgi:hypothetical protein
MCHFSGVTVTVSFDASEGEDTDATLAMLYDELTGNTYHGQGNQ